MEVGANCHAAKLLDTKSRPMLDTVLMVHDSIDLHARTQPVTYQVTMVGQVTMSIICLAVGLNWDITHEASGTISSLREAISVPRSQRCYFCQINVEGCTQMGTKFDRCSF